MTLSRNDIGSLFPNIDMKRASFLSLLDDFFEGVMITDHKGRGLFMNEEQARINDLPPQSLVGKKVTDIYHVDDGDSPTMTGVNFAPMHPPLFSGKACTIG